MVRKKLSERVVTADDATLPLEAELHFLPNAEQMTAAGQWSASVALGQDPRALQMHTKTCAAVPVAPVCCFLLSHDAWFMAVTVA